MERIENNPAIWEKLFPFDLRRELAYNLADKASSFPFVKKIVVVPMDLDGDGLNVSTMYIIVGENLSSGDEDQLESTYKEICPEQTSIEVLGHVVVTSEPKFLKKRNDTLSKYTEATIVWSRDKAQPNDFDRLNFNSCLN
jgi:hypothetical protein